MCAPLNPETCDRQVKFSEDTNYTNQHEFVKVRAICVNSGLSPRLSRKKAVDKRLLKSLKSRPMI